MNLQTTRAAVEAIARQIGERVRKELDSREHAEFKRKGPTDLVTEVDLWAENTVKAEVARSFPDHLVIGEESAHELAKQTGKTLEQLCSKGVCWIVDPIDGTSNFTNRIPIVSVSIGITIDGIRQVGVVYDAGHDEMFSAVRGGGATLNGTPITASKKTALIDGMVATDFPYSRGSKWRVYEDLCRKVLEQSRASRRFGSSAIEQSWIACGRLDAYFEFDLKPWDVAAGSLIVEEAGGRAANFLVNNGNAPFSSFVDSFLFTAPGLFDEVQKILSAPS